LLNSPQEGQVSTILPMGAPQTRQGRLMADSPSRIGFPGGPRC